MKTGKTIWIDGVYFDYDTLREKPEERNQLDAAFSQFFGISVKIEDLLAVYDFADIHLEALRIGGRGSDCFETSGSFTSTDERVSGIFINMWRRTPNGRLERTRDGTLTINGSRKRLALQLHANILKFARKTRIVGRCEVEARDVGRYAYRFLDGVDVDPETRKDIKEKLEHAASFLPGSMKPEKFEALRSPREIVDFIILQRITDGWMNTVNDIIERRHYNFTVDQVVDIARRPGLAFLIDRDSWSMVIDAGDGEKVNRFMESVALARERRSLRRIRGVLGSPFSRLPEKLRTVLITCRPYLFPSPTETPPIPEFKIFQRTESPFRVTGFRTTDGKLERPVDPDPPGVHMRNYRKKEIDAITSALNNRAGLVTVTGLSGSGKTEIIIWNLEKRLSRLGHRVVSIDARHMARNYNTKEVLNGICDVVRPTVIIFDESLYIKGDSLKAVISLAEDFLKWPGRHLVFIGGGRTSAEAQKTVLDNTLLPLKEKFKSAHVPVFPKPANIDQSYRFLGLARTSSFTDEEKLELLKYIFEKFPPYFAVMLHTRFHEHPEIKSLEEAKKLVDQHVSPEEWRSWLGMVWELR